MEIAAFTMSVVALVMTLGNSAFLLGKFLFSRTEIQMVPIDQAVPSIFGGSGHSSSKTETTSRPTSLDLKDIENPLDDTEKEYFQKMNPHLNLTS